MTIQGTYLTRPRYPQIKYLEKEEVYRLFMTIKRKNYRDKALFDLIYRHGLRRIEATWLKKDWVHNSRIWIERAKNGISQEYNLHPASEKLLELYLEQRGSDGNPYLFVSRESRNRRCRIPSSNDLPEKQELHAIFESITFATQRSISMWS